MDIERRTVGDQIEIRTEGEKNVIVGYAATFDTESKLIEGAFHEIIRRGAFDRALSSGVNVLARANHESMALLGCTRAGTLRLSVDDHGLRYEIDAPNTSVGRDIMEYLRRGDIFESSFAFAPRTTKAKWEGRSKQDNKPLRELIDVSLVDISPVIDEAAYSGTQVSARTLEEAQKANAPEPGVPNEINEARLRLQA